MTNELKLLNDCLKEQEVLVTFKKKDGTIRKMKCTKNIKTIQNVNPEFTLKVSDKPKRTINEDIEVVYDLEKMDWRSFRKDSVEQFNTDMFMVKVKED